MVLDGVSFGAGNFAGAGSVGGMPMKMPMSFILVFVVVLAACGGPSEFTSTVGDTARGEVMAFSTAPQEAMAEPPGLDPVDPAPIDGEPSALAGRKFVYTAEMEVEVKNLSESEKAVDEALNLFDGYAESRRSRDSGIQFRLRVPVAHLDDLIGRISELGRVRSHSANIQDVTETYYDLEGRLRNKRLLEERYRQYMKQASTIEEILQVERVLSEISTEIERMEGGFRQLAGRIDLAAVSVTLRPERSVDPSRPGFGQSVKNLFLSFGGGLQTILLVVIGILLYGIPIVLILLFLWWLLFGRIGLLRRLFRMAGKQAKKTV